MIRKIVYQRFDVSNNEHFKFKLCLKCSLELLSSSLDCLDGQIKTNIMHHACGQGNGCKQ